jgi:hypothetical protein
MATATYMKNRIAYRRPQGMLWSDAPGTLASVDIITGLEATIVSGSGTVNLTSGNTREMSVGDMVINVEGPGELAEGAKIVSIESDTSFTVSPNSSVSGSASIKTAYLLYVPQSEEIDSMANLDPNDQFLVLSDHGRAPIDFAPNRIEQRQRMINGRMRSYHIADKLTINTSWSMLPSRSHGFKPEYGEEAETDAPEFTVDGGAGAEEIISWYENHTGPFWVFLSYDKRSNFGNDNNSYGHLNQYSQIIQMYISDINYSVQKRGDTHDMWNISVSLEEV